MSDLIEISPEKLREDWEVMTAECRRDLEAVRNNEAFKEGYENGPPPAEGRAHYIHVFDIAVKVAEMLLQPPPHPDQLRQLHEVANRDLIEVNPLAQKLVGSGALVAPMQHLVNTGCHVPGWTGWFTVDARAISAAEQVHQACRSVAGDTESNWPGGVAVRFQIGLIGGVNLALTFLWDEKNELSVGLTVGLNILQLGANVGVEYLKLKGSLETYYRATHLALALNLTIGVGVTFIAAIQYFSLGLSAGANVQLGGLLSWNIRF